MFIISMFSFFIVLYNIVLKNTDLNQIIADNKIGNISKCVISINNIYKRNIV